MAIGKPGKEIISHVLLRNDSLKPLGTDHYMTTCVIVLYSLLRSHRLDLFDKKVAPRTCPYFVTKLISAPISNKIDSGKKFSWQKSAKSISSFSNSLIVLDGYR